MKIFIQARKDGYNVLFPTPTTPTEFYRFASDIQSASANNNAIYYGRNFYTLAFASSGCIFTKYVIGYDIQRNNLGNVGISVFIPNAQKLPGKDVKILLDGLLDIYYKNYCPDNNIGDKREDWLLFTSFADSHDEKLLPRSSNYPNVTTGTQDPAFHYYKSDSELIEHLDKPFQEEYSDYKQILFIDSNLQRKANPLDILKNSGVELNPDLKNESYYLSNYNSTKGVKITANGKPRSDIKGNNLIRANWNVVIEYSKNYFKPIKVEGFISNPASDIHKHLEINGNNIIIKYDSFFPKPETKTFTFDVVTKKDGVTVTDAEIKVDTQPWQSRSEVTFTDEELGREHKIVARKGDTLYSDAVKITPKNYLTASITLQLIEKRVLKITVVEAEGEKNYISDFKVWISNGKCNTQKVKEVTFADDEIDDTYNITVEKDGYIRSSSKSYCPKNDESTIQFELRKAIKQSTTDSNIQNEQTSHRHESQKQKSFTTKTKAFFTLPVIGVVIVLFLGVGFWALYHFSNKHEQPEETPLTTQKITTYVEGNSLLLNILNDFKKDWKLQEQKFIIEAGGGFFGGEKIVDSTKWKSEWKPTYERIEKAINKRKLIDDKNIAELRNGFYYPRQFPFQSAIEKIDNTKYEEVRTQLGDVSTLTLAQIADSIHAILILKAYDIQEQPLEPEKGEKKQETSENGPQPKEQPNIEEQKPAATDKTSEIIQYIKGSELDETKLKEYENTKGINQNLKNSIQLCLDFWELDGSGQGKRSKTYWSFREKVNADTNFNNSKLKAFVEQMCQQEVPATYSKQDKKKGLRI